MADQQAIHNHVFIKCPQETWISGRIVSINDKEAVVRCSESCEQRTVSLGDYAGRSLPLQNTHAYGDMINLPFLHEVSYIQ